MSAFDAVIVLLKSRLRSLQRGLETDNLVPSLVEWAKARIADYKAAIALLEAAGKVRNEDVGTFETMAKISGLSLEQPDDSVSGSAARIYDLLKRAALPEGRK